MTGFEASKGSSLWANTWCKVAAGEGFASCSTVVLSCLGPGIRTATVAWCCHLCVPQLQGPGRLSLLTQLSDTKQAPAAGYRGSSCLISGSAAQRSTLALPLIAQYTAWPEILHSLTCQLHL